MAVLLLSVLASHQTLAQSQSSGAYFLGEWSALLTGMPDGDLPFIINFSIAEDSLQATIYDEAQTFVMPIEKVVMKGENALSLSFYEYNSGTNVTINLLKKDEDNLTGDVLNMYSIKATRKKQP